MTALPASDHRIRRAAIEALGRRRVTPEALAGELEAAGIDLGPEGVERLEGVLDGSSEFVELDGGWLGVSAQLDGTSWITTVDTDDAKAGALALEPDLVLLGWWLLDVTLTLGESGEALEVDDDLSADGALIGPPGWLDVYAGRSVAVNVVQTTLHLAAANEPNPSTDVVAAVRATFEQHAVFQELRDMFGTEPVDLTQMSVEDLLWESLATNRDVFTAQPIPPIDLLIAAAGLTREHHTVLRADVDLGALHRWRRRNRVAVIHRLEDEQVDWAEFVIAMSDTTISGLAEPFDTEEGAQATATAFAVALADPA